MVQILKLVNIRHLFVSSEWQVVPDIQETWARTRKPQIVAKHSKVFHCPLGDSEPLEHDFGGSESMKK